MDCVYLRQKLISNTYKISAYMMQKVLKENAVVTFLFCLEVAF